MLFGHHYVVGCLGTAVSPAALDYHQSLPNSPLHHHNLHRDNVSLNFAFFLFGFLCTSCSLGYRNFLILFIFRMLSAAHYALSNKRAEAAVKTAKRLLCNNTERGDMMDSKGATKA